MSERREKLISFFFPPSRSSLQYPSSWQASLLLGLERLNYGKDPRNVDRSKAFELGLKLVADSFKGSGMKSSAAAAAISTSFALENEDYAKVRPQTHSASLWRLF